MLLPPLLQVRILKSTLAPLDSIAAHQEACRAVAVAPTDVKFATCSDDQSVKVWDLATLSADRTLTGAPCSAAAYFAVYSITSCAKVWDLAT